MPDQDLWERLKYEVAQARANRAAGSQRREDILSDRYGTGEEMGVFGIPTAVAYELSKPVLRASPTLNELLGAVAGPEQMVGPNTSVASPREALENIQATSAGALSRSALGRALLGLYMR